MLCCPVCRGLLTDDTTRFLCGKGHSFDKASSGYVNLLLSNKKHSAIPGDNKAMVRSRTAFLNTGAYQCLADALALRASQLLCGQKAPHVLDAGCGEGYYTHHIQKALPKDAKVLGIDISKFACDAAAKRTKDVQFAAASAFDLPCPDNSVDLLTSVFAPLAVQEFCRVVNPKGYLLLAVAGKRHLWDLKTFLYQTPYENDEELPSFPGMVQIHRQRVCSQITVDGQPHIQALFSMTPYAYKTPREAVYNLSQLESLHTQVEFDIYTFQKQ